MDLPERPFDGRLHLLDRQVVDRDGLLVCKVDDCELVERDGTLEITALLAGAAPLVRRLGGRLGRGLVGWLGALGVAQAHWAEPSYVELADVASVDSDVRLRVSRASLLRHRPVEHTLGDLLGLDVVGPDGAALGRVIDVRLERRDDRLVVTGLLVGRVRPGGFLGYDRARAAGPWLVATVVRRLHRGSGLAPAAGAEIDWDGHRVRIARPPRPLLGYPSPA